jgi:prephenate dehydrogenase
MENELNINFLHKHTLGIIGLGLIGGSIAKTLKYKGFNGRIVGVDDNKLHATEAVELNIVDEVLSLEECIQEASIICIAIPVKSTLEVATKILEAIAKDTIVFDVGSTKASLCNLIQQHKNGSQFVATHPMWGTEFSGPAAALHNAFEGRACVICNKENTNAVALTTIEKLYAFLGMHLLYMNADEHDIHAAYVSHISHITSFALANTVLEKEKEENTIFELAAGGFESTVRLAKSNPAMWAPIFMQNRENVLDVLNEHIAQLRKFKACLEKENEAYLYELMNKANEIKRILK